MSSLLAALSQPPRLVAAVSQERWLELVHHPSSEVSSMACWGLARLATFENDWSIADPLLNLEGNEALSAAVRSAGILGAKEALPRLRARLDTLSPQDAVGVLRVLDTLGDEARAQLPPERLQAIERAAYDSLVFTLAREKRPAEFIASAAITEVETRWGSFVERSGGSSRELTLLASIVGEDSLTLEDVEAWRRRDAAALAEAIARLAEVDVEKAPQRDRREIELRRQIALACRETILDARPKRAELDAVAVAGLVQAVMLRARSKPQAASALPLAFLGDPRVWESAPEADPTSLERLQLLASSALPRAREALVACALGWKLPQFAPQILESARTGSLLWGFMHAQLATRLEAPLLAALDEEPGADGRFSLLAQLVSTEAENRVVALASSKDVGTRLYLPLAVRSFPSERVLDAVRKAPPLEEIELRRRLALLAEFDPALASLDQQAPSLYCHACSAFWNVTPESLAQVGRVLVPDPALPCPSCETMGSATGTDPTHLARTWRIRPSIDAHESPRSALERFLQSPDEHALDIVETLALCGEKDRALSAFQLVSKEERVAEATRAAELLLALGEAGLAKETLMAALSHPEAWAVWSQEETKRLGTLLARACAELGEEVPAITIEPPSTRGLDNVSISSDKVGRNEPCPCGSGKKYKRCHG